MQATSKDCAAPNELWRLGMLVVDADDNFQELRHHPLRLLAWFTPPSQQGGTALAVGKLSLLDTFDHVHEYEAKKGVRVPLRASSTQRCRYPHVAVVPFKDMGNGKEAALMTLDLQPPALERHTGLTRPTSPAILVASKTFLTSYGFSSSELVWVQAFVPLPLDRVVLSTRPGREGLSLTPNLVEQAMQHLFQRMKEGPVLFRQGTAFSFPASFFLGKSEQQRHEVAAFTVLECSPVMQGQLTEQTVVAVLPEEEAEEEGEGDEEEEVVVEEEVDMGLPMSLPPSLPRKSCMSSLSSSEEVSLEAGMVDSWESKPRSGSVISNRSASDFRNEEEISDPMLEVVTHADIKLHKHYVILPESFAREHELFQYQTVLLVAEETRQDSPAGLVSFVLSTRRKKYGDERAEGSHGAIVLWYDDQAELEQYVPPPFLGYSYEREALQAAYVHPFLLYSLFHETLSPTRKYFISIKKLKGEKEEFQRVKVVSVAPVDFPDYSHDVTRKEVIAELKQYFQQRTHLVAVGDIFRLHFEKAGVLHYRIMSIVPEDGRKIDSSLREILWQEQTVNFHLPYHAPPSPYHPPPSYFSHLLPPGLEGPCLSLFSYFLPLLQKDPTARPFRSPAVILTGPGGVGKSTVVRAVARRTRSHLLEVNCYNYCSDSVAAAETKFTNDLAKAFSSNPCVVLLKNVHKLGRDNKREEPRTAAALHSFIYYISFFNRRQNFPIMVTATSSQPQSISSQVAIEFLHTIELAPPTEPQRLAMVTELATSYLTAPGIRWRQLAIDSSGFVLGDLVSLLSRASHLATTSTIQHYEASRGSAPSSHQLAVSGVAVTQSHMEEALAQLHLAHSDAIGAPKIPDVRWEDVGGLAQAKQEVLDAIQLPLQHPELFSGGLRRSGVLLYGPPGTGKTLLAKAVATECAIHFLSVKGPELINMYVGQTEENVRDVFARARGAAPCIIFFDELDSIAPNRGKMGDSGGVMDRVVSQLLAELDGLQKSADVFVIGATNRPDLLDPALLRPGRFDRLVYLGACEDVESRLKILRAITRKFTLAADVDLRAISEQCPAHLTGADLYALCSEALLVALRRTVQQLEEAEQGEESLQVTKDDFCSSLSSLTPSVSQSELERYQDLRKTATST